MSERFRFDQRVQVPKAIEGKAVVKFFGLPVLVSAPCAGDISIGSSGLTEKQLGELSEIVAEKGIDSLINQKQQVAKGGKL